MTNKKTVITSIDDRGVVTISENIDYLKNGIYSLANNLKTPVKLMAGILTISLTCLWSFTMKSDFTDKEQNFYVDSKLSIQRCRSFSLAITDLSLI